VCPPQLDKEERKKIVLLKVTICPPQLDKEERI
jgi:hypothetical protein